MTEAAIQQGPRYYCKPVEYKGVVFGLERFSECMPELLALGIQEWKEVGDEKRFGKFDPDIERALEYEARNGLFPFTVRNLRSMAMEGYVIMTVAPSLKQRGRYIAQESGVYLQPTARTGRPWLMRKLMTYMEDFFSDMGVHAIELGYHPYGDPRVGRFYERCKYFQSAVSYHKVLNNA